MNRIMILGPCGSGKSTLACRLGQMLDLPSYHLDQLMWSAGWVERDECDWRPELEAIVRSPRWVIDGNDASTMELRLARADQVVFLEFSAARCLWRVIRRIWSARGTTRPDMAPDCPERFDAGFLWYVATWHNRPRKRIERALAGHEDEVLYIRSPRELERWLASLSAR